MDKDAALKNIEKGFAKLDISKKYQTAALKNIKKWLTDDTFANYQAQIYHLIKKGEFNLLLDSFYQVIPFGTGGRRGPVGVGTNRINPWTIMASAQGHAEYLIKNHKDAKNRGIVVAYDVREYPDTGIYDNSITNPVKGLTSKQLASYASDVYTANGIKIYLFKEITTTPELSFAIRHLNAIAGVMISASHNPKEDNGKKVYSSDGGQLIPPHDELLADTVNAVKTINDKENKSLLEKIGEDINKAYISETTKLSNYPDQRDINILFTPLHGVGASNVAKTLKQLGFKITIDEKTKTPDGGFPNVKFNIPNPEVPESFETCYVDNNADIILATDPDADRMGVSVKHKNKWHYLNGNQIGIIALASLLFANKEKKKLTKDSTVVKTLVTTSLLNKICEHYKVNIIDDLLVGFKYIAHEIAKLEKQGKPDAFIMGLEESHGFLTGNYCRDKDGVCACVILAELASFQKSQNKTLIDFLDEIYDTFGYADNMLSSIVLEGAMGMEQMQHLMDTLRKEKPTTVGKFKVDKVDDKWEGPKFLSETDKSSRNVIVLHFEPKDLESLKLTIRPSGTQPATKMYFEAVGKKGTDKKKVINIRKQLRISFLSYVYDILDMDMPERGFLLSDLLPVPLKLQYFDIEKKLVEKKDKITEEEILELLKPLGKDPIEKIDDCFKAEHKVSFRKYFGMES